MGKRWKTDFEKIADQIYWKKLKRELTAFRRNDSDVRKLRLLDRERNINKFCPLTVRGYVNAI